MDFIHPVRAVIAGAQGRVLAVLAETTAELNLRTLAGLAGVSIAQVSRVLPGLVELGIVERREVPPSSQFRLVREHVTAEAVLQLANLRQRALERIGVETSDLPVAPAAVILFGSFARGEADRHSDLDVIVVRPDDIDEDDESWTDGLERWRDRVRLITGNPIEMIEVSLTEARGRFASGAGMWSDAARDGVVVFGAPASELFEKAGA